MNGALSLRPRAVLLVVSLELRQRLRSRSWYVALGVWTVVLLGLGLLGLTPALLVRDLVSLSAGARLTLSFQMILVLSAMLLVVPALSGGSINGDRSAGTLAVLQASLLGSLEIVVGKLLAGWATGLAFLVLALPSVLPLAVLAQISPFYLLRMVLVIAVLAGCVSAVGLGLSSLTNRQLGSVVLVYVLVVGVTVVLPLAWAASGLVLSRETIATVYTEEYDPSAEYPSYDSPGRCVASEEEVTEFRWDVASPLLWVNPVVLLAEAAPTVDLRSVESSAETDADTLVLLKLGVRVVSSPPHPSAHVFCDVDAPGYPADIGEPPQRPVGLLGLGLWVLAAIASLAIATRRLAVPARRLGRGTRIA